MSWEIVSIWLGNIDLNRGWSKLLFISVLSLSKRVPGENNGSFTAEARAQAHWRAEGEFSFSGSQIMGSGYASIMIYYNYAILKLRIFVKRNAGKGV